MKNLLCKIGLHDKVILPDGIEHEVEIARRGPFDPYVRTANFVNEICTQCGKKFRYESINDGW
jgi:hypothetical protein